MRRIGRERGAQRGLDEPVNGDVLIGERDQVVVGEQGQGFVDGGRSGGRRPGLHRYRESGAGYGLGRVPREGVEQLRRQGGGLLQGPERGAPDAGDGPVRVVAVAGGVQHRGGRPGENVPVRGEGHAGLPEVRTCLREGQGQVTELRGQGVGLPEVVTGGLRPGHGQATQQADRRLRGQHVDAQRLCAGTPAVRAPAGDELVPVAAEPSEVGVDVRGVLGVVEDEEPAVVRLEPQDRPLGLLIRQCAQRPAGVQKDREIGEGRVHLLAALGDDPPDKGVIGTVLTDVPHGEGRLAHPAQAVQRLELGDDPLAEGEGPPNARHVAGPAHEGLGHAQR